MGKRPDDLPLSDAPLRPPEPDDEREAAWYQFAEELHTLLDSGDFTWATDTLAGILASVEQYKTVTPGQRRAVANVQAARTRADGGGRRRYEGFDRRRGGW